jgi:uncharacterized protein involved in type VI secretion and phage assembly
MREHHEAGGAAPDYLLLVLLHLQEALQQFQIHIDYATKNRAIKNST